MNAELELAKIMAADAPRWRQGRAKLENVAGVSSKAGYASTKGDIIGAAGEANLIERWTDRKKRVAAEKAAVVAPAPKCHVGTRAAAKKLGALRYDSGRRCRHGHLSERLTSNGHCVRCRRVQEAQRRKGASTEQGNTNAH